MLIKIILYIYENIVNTEINVNESQVFNIRMYI
jgi:hypothetical protein